MVVGYREKANRGTRKARVCRVILVVLGVAVVSVVRTPWAVALLSAWFGMECSSRRVVCCSGS